MENLWGTFFAFFPPSIISCMWFWKRGTNSLILWPSNFLWEKNKSKVQRSLWASLLNWFGTTWWVIPGAPSLQGAECSTSATISAPPRLWQGIWATFWTVVFHTVLWGEVVAQSFQLRFDCSCSCFPIVAVTPMPSVVVAGRGWQCLWKAVYKMSLETAGRSWLRAVPVVLDQ